jgi:hypothetical protein
MTTTVTITAHLSTEKEVRVKLTDNGSTTEEFALQDGIKCWSANARLIAAAPDLLRYLKEARRTLEMWKDVAPAVSLCADIDAAIARATGEQP